MTPQEILKKSRDLAKDVLRESLAELSYEAKNGLDRGRIQRFSLLATRADALLSAELSRPRAARRGQQSKQPTGKQTKAEAIVAAIREERGEWVPGTVVAARAGIKVEHLGGYLKQARKRTTIEAERGKGYRIKP